MNQCYRVCLFVGVLFGIIGCQSPETTITPTTPIPSSQTGQSNYGFFVQDFIDSVMEAEQIPGLAIGMIREGRVDWTQSYGFADAEQFIQADPATRFRLGPSAQVMTTVAVLQVVEDFNLDLDRDLRSAFPFDFSHPVFPSATISLRMLLSHASGLRDRAEVLDSLNQAGDPQITLGEFLENYIAPEGLYYDEENYSQTRPGKSYQYARVNIALAAYLVEVTTGIDFDIYCKTRLFGQLGYTSVSWFLNDLPLQQVAVPYRLQGEEAVPQPRIGYPAYPSGQLRISATYVARFWLAMLEGGSYNGESIISPTALAEMREVSYPFANPTQALGWRYDTLGNRPLLGLSGTELGMSARMYADPDQAQGLVILSNGDWYEPALDSLTVKLMMAVDALNEG